MDKLNLIKKSAERNVSQNAKTEPHLVQSNLMQRVANSQQNISHNLSSVKWFQTWLFSTCCLYNLCGFFSQSTGQQGAHRGAKPTLETGQQPSQARDWLHYFSPGQCPKSAVIPVQKPLMNLSRDIPKLLHVSNILLSSNCLINQVLLKELYVHLRVIIRRMTMFSQFYFLFSSNTKVENLQIVQAIQTSISPFSAFFSYSVLRSVLFIFFLCLCFIQGKAGYVAQGSNYARDRARAPLFSYVNEDKLKSIETYARK